MTRPPYTPTDFVPIAAAFLFATLNLLTLLGVIHLDATQKTDIVNAFSDVDAILIGLFLAHRAVKHVVANLPPTSGDQGGMG